MTFVFAMYMVGFITTFFAAAAALGAAILWILPFLPKVEWRKFQNDVRLVTVDKKRILTRKSGQKEYTPQEPRIIQSLTVPRIIGLSNIYFGQGTGRGWFFGLMLLNKED